MNATCSKVNHSSLFSQLAVFCMQDITLWAISQKLLGQTHDIIKLTWKMAKKKKRKKTQLRLWWDTYVSTISDQLDNIHFERDVTSIARSEVRGLCSGILRQRVSVCTQTVNSQSIHPSGLSKIWHSDASLYFRNAITIKVTMGATDLSQALPFGSHYDMTVASVLTMPGEMW